MKRTKLLMVLAALTLFIGNPAFALELHQARASGLVGEKQDGYVEARQATPEVTALVGKVNAERRQEYTQISQQKGQSTDVVAQLAAQQILGNLEHGAFYQAADGSWKQH